MAEELKISFLQSSNAKNVTFIDESTDVSFSDYVRTVEIYTGRDATGTLLDTLTFLGVENTVEYSINRDAYFSAKLIYTALDADLTPAIINFVTTQYEYNALVNKQKINCGCVSSTCGSTFNGFIYLYLAQKATEFGNSGLANTFISSSYTYLTK